MHAEIQMYAAEEQPVPSKRPATFRMVSHKPRFPAEVVRKTL